MSQIDLAKVKRGEKKDSFVCSTNTYCARQDASANDTAPGTRSPLSSCFHHCRGWGWVCFGFVLLSFLWFFKILREMLIFSLFFSPFFIILVTFYISYFFLHISGIILEKGQIRSLGGRRLPVLVQGSLSVKVRILWDSLILFPQAHCFTLKNGWRTSRRCLYKT